jgi:hypothetical protein
MRSLLAVGLLSGLSIVVPSSPACACDCASLSRDEALARADAVFVGVVTDVATPWRWLMWSSADPVTVTFDVDTAYKGVVPAEARVRTARESPSCGYPFEVGQRYLVYVDVQADGTWATTLCDGNQTVDETTALPIGGYPPVADMTQPRRWWPLGAAALAVGALAVVVFIARVRRRRRNAPADS